LVAELGGSWRISLEWGNKALLSNAECAEDQVQDIVVRCGPSDLIERPQGVVQIKQEHFVRDSVFDGYSRRRKRCKGFSYVFLVPQVAEKSIFDLGAGVSSDVTQNLIPQLGDSFSGGRGSSNSG
jgi:hypothetical protein